MCHNLANVRLGSHICVSQQAYICTGSHDYRKPSFDLVTRPVRVGHGAWLGARAIVFGGVAIGANALVRAEASSPRTFRPMRWSRATPPGRSEEATGAGNREQ